VICQINHDSAPSMDLFAISKPKLNPQWIIPRHPVKDKLSVQPLHHRQRKNNHSGSSESCYNSVEISVQIQLGIALVALHRTPENFLAASWTDVAGFFVLSPFFRTELSSIWDRAQNHLFADSHRKIFDVPAGEFVALMTAGVSFPYRAVSDLTLSAMHKPIIRQAPAAADVFC
jgi:hypothetical protein